MSARARLVRLILMSRTMRLDELAGAVPEAAIVGAPGGRPGDDAVSLSGIAYDSRRVVPGGLFVAVRGERFDGREFLGAAVASGAAAVALDADGADAFAALPVPRLLVPDARAALAPLACRFFGDPTRYLHLTGVTGTNGKTTTTRLIDAIARAAGETTGVIGTLGATIAGIDLPGERTTPEAPDLQALFDRMRGERVASAAMEVASHALALGRTDGCAFDVAAFTNLTQDHLDFHGNMDAYRDAKARLFTDYADAARAAGKTPTAVLNADDPAGRHYGALGRAGRVLFYSARGAANADVTLSGLRLAVDRITFTAHTPAGDVPVELGFGGSFNVENALAAIGCGVARGFSADTIARGLAACPPVPGRFQPVRAGQPFAVLVDYAHTPDGLENVLRSARPLTPGRLIVVFGCGGNRDRTKRPLMGRLARQLADVAVVTSDNPRREEPEAILDEILAGMTAAAATGDGAAAAVHREADRRAAIGLAVGLAGPDDTVVIAGKGHENYQIVGDATFPFDDAVVACEEIVARCAR
jgi:UDP-N-acetylmuramoyl-L-alanyl-D-glutamate--2,6-diaminopimelate ligase